MLVLRSGTLVNAARPRHDLADAGSEPARCQGRRDRGAPV